MLCVPGIGSLWLAREQNMFQVRQLVADSCHLAIVEVGVVTRTLARPIDIRWYMGSGPNAENIGLHPSTATNPLATATRRTARPNR